MYNADTKELFLNSLIGRYAEGTIIMYRRILNKAEETEEVYGVDIYDFNLEQCQQLLKSYSNRSKDMFAVNRSILETYSEWCIVEGYNPSRINYFSMITIDNADEYIDHNAIAKKVLTYEDLWELEKMIINPQDFMSLLCPYIGVYGKEAKEMIELKVNDVYEDHIHLKNRDIPIDDLTYAMFQDAINQEEYFTENGEPSENTRITTRSINKTEYVIRVTGSTKFEQASYNLIKGRLDRLKKFCGSNLTLTNLMLSGKVHIAKEILKQKGEIMKEDWIEINKRFGATDEKALNYWTVTKERVNPYLNL